MPNSALGYNAPPTRRYMAKAGPNHATIQERRSTTKNSGPRRDQEQNYCQAKGCILGATNCGRTATQDGAVGYLVWLSRAEPACWTNAGEAASDASRTKDAPNKVSRRAGGPADRGVAPEPTRCLAPRNASSKFREAKRRSANSSQKRFLADE